MPKNFPSLASRLRLTSRVVWGLAAILAIFALVSFARSLAFSPDVPHARSPLTQPGHTGSSKDQTELASIFASRSLREVSPPKPIASTMPVPKPAPPPPPPPKPPELELVATLVEGETEPMAYVRVKGSKNMLKVAVGGEVANCKVLEIVEGQIMVEFNGETFPIGVRKGS